MKEQETSEASAANNNTMEEQDTGEASTTAASSLDQRYFYQNPSTGAISPTALTVKQLCRMFSPPISSDTAEGTAIIQPSSSSSRFGPESQLLALTENGQYDPEGWKPAKEIPIVKHAACSAFYYCHATTSDKTPQGPLSCRQLALQMLGPTKTLDSKTVQVNGTSTDNQWTYIDAIPDLRAAMEAFLDPPQPVVAAATDSSQIISSQQQEDYDVSQMIFPDNSQTKNNDAMEDDNDDAPEHNYNKDQEVQDELEAFLSATDPMGPNKRNAPLDDEGDDIVGDEGYVSDGGTKYVKDLRTGNWIHQALVPKMEPPPNKKKKTAPTNNNKSNGNNNNNNNNGTINPSTKKKSKKPKFAARNAKCWIYITGLPTDTDEEEVAKFCSKVGIIDLDPETQKPKVKLYRHQDGTCKGDASIGYARPESVELALQVLDEAPFREFLLVAKNQDPYRIHVQRAKFEQHGDYAQQKDRKKRVSQAQRQVARLAAKQAVDWDDGEFNGRLTGGLKGLRIIVLKRMFHPSELPAGESEKEDAMLAELEQTVRKSCEEFGAVEKITVFSQNPQGVLVVKFTQPGAASDAVKAWNGRPFAFQQQKRKVEASFWDGVTDFTVRDEEKEEKEMEARHEEFGAWLESHKEDQLPEEFRLKVEDAA